ncbi:MULTISPECIES: cellulase family glycosylhydrolase [unclassified Nocardioides]|uniref:cellulase family glycosylhydrolase n=1 Tax=unclassified Nocardioides TaxID=2615069 RepID=UPI00070304D9|nr:MULTISPECIES: cellulase family glycosylhydrolase [unclassified Nocardioides]KRC48872.1 hypothetical protein ASE19_18310 [Nocardioides sp. Root79]KRC75271.1 hypothetical protein ASE20_20210 [Nocardioides sp. Root240]
MHTSTFERRLDGFAGVADSRVALSRVGVGHHGTRALVLRAVRTGPASVQAGRRVGAHRAGARYVVRGWARASARRTVALVVQEVKAGRVLQTRRVRLVAGPAVWRRLPVSITTRAVDSALRVRVRAPRLVMGNRVFVDDLTVTRVFRSAAPAPSTTTPPSGCTLSARGIPSCGVYVGAAHGSNTDPSTLESTLGGRLAVRRTYFTASGVDKAIATARTDLAAGRLPWISFKLPRSWEEMAAGRGDAWAKDIAQRLEALGGPVWVAFHHEPEGDGDIQAWRRMQEHLAPLVRTTAPHVAFTVVVTGWNQFYGAAQYRLSEIWPRGVKVDVAGFDIYQQYGVTKDGRTTTKWTDFADYYGKISTWAKSVGVSWGLGETGVTDAAAAARPAVISDSVDLMRTYGGIAYSYFDTTLNSVANWSLSTAAKRQSFASALTGTTRLR